MFKDTQSNSASQFIVREGVRGEYFVKTDFGVFAGVFKKMGCRTWFLDGEFVVNCVVNVVS